MIKKAYFTSRHQIIQWVNHILDISLSKIEQLGAGNIYCHLLDAAYPSKVPLHKVKWEAYQEIDFIYNFKILQCCFEHFGIPKTIDIQKLSKAKYQDNLQFIQWMKWQFGQRIKNNRFYNAQERRQYTPINLELSHKFVIKKSISNASFNKENHNTSNYMDNCEGNNRRERNSFSFVENKSYKQTPSYFNHNNTTVINYQQQNPYKLQLKINNPNNMMNCSGIKTSRERVNTESNRSMLSSRLYTEYIMQAQEPEDQCF